MNWMSALGGLAVLAVTAWGGYSYRDSTCEVADLTKSNALLQGVVDAYAEAAAQNDQLQSQVDQLNVELGKKRETVKTVYRTLTKEVIRDAEVVYRDVDCSVPQRFVRMWNAANRASSGFEPEVEDAGAGPGADEAPSGVGLGDIEVQHLREAEICSDAIHQVKGWQAYYEVIKTHCSGEQK
jgi:cell division protein FtsB